MGALPLLGHLVRGKVRARVRVFRGRVRVRVRVIGYLGVGFGCSAAAWPPARC